MDKFFMVKDSILVGKEQEVQGIQESFLEEELFQLSLEIGRDWLGEEGG